VTLLRRIMERNGDADKAVWINEFGWNAAPADFTPDKLIWQRVTEQQQADYTITGLRMARQWDWIGVVSFWYLRQVGNIRPDSAEYYFRMVDVDFTPRLVYRAIKAETALPGPTAGYFEESSPSVSPGPGWRYEVSSAASGGQHLAASDVGATLTISFTGSTLAIIAAREPDGGALYVTIDGQPANALPKTKSGQAVLDLAGATTRWQVQTTVADNLRAGQHVAQLTRSPQGGRVTLDSFVVGQATTERSLSLLVFVAGLAVCADLGLLWREARRR
jgi:hypothetical protein